MTDVSDASALSTPAAQAGLPGAAAFIGGVCACFWCYRRWSKKEQAEERERVTVNVTVDVSSASGLDANNSNSSSHPAEATPEVVDEKAQDNMGEPVTSEAKPDLSRGQTGKLSEPGTADTQDGSLRRTSALRLTSESELGTQGGSQSPTSLIGTDSTVPDGRSSDSRVYKSKKMVQATYRAIKSDQSRATEKDEIPPGTFGSSESLPTTLSQSSSAPADAAEQDEDAQDTMIQTASEMPKQSMSRQGSKKGKPKKKIPKAKAKDENKEGRSSVDPSEVKIGAVTEIQAGYQTLAGTEVSEQAPTASLSIDRTAPASSTSASATASSLLVVVASKRLTPKKKPTSKKKPTPTPKQTDVANEEGMEEGNEQAGKKVDASKKEVDAATKIQAVYRGSHARQTQVKLQFAYRNDEALAEKLRGALAGDAPPVGITDPAGLSAKGPFTTQEVEGKVEVKWPKKDGSGPVPITLSSELYAELFSEALIYTVNVLQEVDIHREAWIEEGRIKEKCPKVWKLPLKADGSAITGRPYATQIGVRECEPDPSSLPTSVPPPSDYAFCVTGLYKAPRRLGAQFGEIVEMDIMLTGMNDDGKYEAITLSDINGGLAPLPTLDFKLDLQPVDKADDIKIKTKLLIKQ
eukprot:gnl/MRDRNA2_/MRDRNA2_79958_c0_seq3.p1 gnl/MRDRNA2_/MRDRNA2_79958_c0~~gnl/MRDRNA2_/MRDRNA2_79958_c0_seq3.p1  ORF type:complete len:657 (-),score=136.13 gnl/MRDRNA2_/MRDRNA2_79958_c0_seq3:89-1993(-)